MAKGQHLSQNQQRIVKDYYQHLDTRLLQKLGELVSELYLSSDEPAKTVRLWTSVRKALEQLKIEPGRISSMLAKRNIEELAMLLGDLNLSAKAPASTTPAHAQAPPPTSQPVPPAAAPAQDEAVDRSDPADRQTLKRALKAFRKRLKLTRLDEESGLGYGPMTGGRKSSVVAIQPPNQYPEQVWAELVTQGRLKEAGRGFYELVEP
jgi:hypothetical protein